jgi:hypothetical protein
MFIFVEAESKMIVLVDVDFIWKFLEGLKHHWFSKETMKYEETVYPKFLSWKLLQLNHENLSTTFKVFV